MQKKFVIAFSVVLSLLSAAGSVMASYETMPSFLEKTKLRKYAILIQEQQDQEEFKNDVTFCIQYRLWQQLWVKQVKDTLNDPQKDITWWEFVQIKEGNHVPAMERKCWMIEPLPDSTADF